MPKKRMNGEGSYHKRPNGLWKWQIMLGYQKDGRRKMKSIYARSQKELKQKAKQFLEEYRSRPQLDSTDMETIQSLSGHADIDMTEHYLHVQSEVKSSAVAKLNDMFAFKKSA